MITRPEALQGVLYKNVGLSLVRSEGGPRLVMTLRHKENQAIRRSVSTISITPATQQQAKRRRVRQSFTKEAYLPICIFLLLLAMAFADDAFDAGIPTPDQIYRLVISPRKNCLAINWKRKWWNRPIVRDIECASDSTIKISNTKPIDLQKYRKQFRHLGRLCGDGKLPEPYDLQRAGGNADTSMYRTVLLLNRELSRVNY